MQSATLEIGKYLLKKGWIVKIITNKYPIDLESKDKLDSINIRRFIFLSNPMEYFLSLRIDLLLGWIILKPLTLINLIIYFNRYRPKFVNLHFPDHQLLECYILKKIFGFKLILSLHGDEVERLQKLNKLTFRYFLYNKLFISSIFITGCSSYLLVKFNSLFPHIDSGKCLTLSNGVNSHFINQKLNNKKNDYIFSAGRFVYKKGFDLLIKALDTIKDQKIQIAGFSELSPELLDLQNKLGNRINLLGKISKNIMLDYLSQTRLTVIPSREEPYGIIVAEAICSGSPVLATNVGGIPEIINLIQKELTINEKKIFQNFVKLVDPNIDSLRSGILKMIKNQNDYENYLEIVEKIRKIFLWENRLTQYESYLKT